MQVTTPGRFYYIHLHHWQHNGVLVFYWVCRPVNGGVCLCVCVCVCVCASLIKWSGQVISKSCGFDSRCGHFDVVIVSLIGISLLCS